MAFGASEIVLLVALLVTIIFAYVIFRPQSPKSSVALGNGKDKKEEKKKEKSSKPRMIVFFGSQSGTAETFAQDLADEAKTYGFAAESVDLEGYEKDDLANEKFAVFLMATFGEGEPTDNSAEFYEWINQTEREEDLFKDVCFAVFALGNRQYEHFCSIGRKLDKRMAKLGGERLLEHGEGDDDGSLETDYAEWKSKFWQATKKKFGIGPTDEDGKVPEFKPSFDITWTPYDKSTEDAAKAKGTQTPHTKYVSGMDGFKPDPKHKVEQALVVQNRELRTDITDGNSTRHIELDIKDCLFSYITADNLGVYPRNDYKLAGKLATRLGVNLKDLFTLKPKDMGSSRKSHYPKIVSVQDALHWYCDFGALAKLKTVATFAQYAEDEKEKHKLLKCVTEDKENFLEDKKAIWEVLEEFPSVKIPFHAFLELVPRVQPRYYTISSSSKASPSRIAITVAVTVDKLTNGREHRGLCSSYLQSLREDKDKIPVFIRSSTFRLPSQISTPVIMVGPGTGVAPFRGFLHDAWTISKAKKEELKLGDWHLYFGCKHSKKDYIYQDEMEKAKSDGILKKLELAFSRDTDEKIYVQHRLSNQGTELWEIIHTKRAHFYVCGGTAMGRDVKNAIIKIATEQGKLSADAAAKYVKDLQTKGRYIQELWS